MAHEVGYGEEGRQLTWQAEFPEEVECHACGKIARHAITVKEKGAGSDNACSAHKNDPSGEGFWLHDCAAFATYLCTDIKCAEATTMWNQG